MNISIVVGEFHRDIAEVMVSEAKKEAKKMKVKVIDVIWIPGSYEAPIVTDKLLRKKAIDAVVVLGYIDKGETMHGEVMGHVVHGALIDLQLKYRKPIGLGMIGPGATEKQAHVRKERAAQAAMRAAVKVQATLKKLL